MPLPCRFLLAFLLLVTAVSASAQGYTSIVVLGDSLSDTGNDTHVSTAAYTAAAAVPAPATGYTQGSFTDGTDTSPAARLYTGVWIKQLAALLPARPSVVDSLDGGTNYAYGFAFTGSGTSTLSYGPGNIFSFPVHNMGLQLSTYLATSPTITSKTLFVLWGGANDLLNATSTAAVTTAAANELGILQTLISAGATDFLIVDLPPLGAIPRLMGTGSTATALTAASALFNQTLATGLTALPAANPGKTLHLYPLDVFSLFNAILAAPSTYGFADVVDMSQYTPVNPDTYLFWDGLHPTTAGHHLIATAALSLLSPATTTTTVSSSALSANLGTSVTFTATVASTGGIPPGVVTFYDGSTALGNGQLSGSSPDTATFTTTSLAAGTHTITAAYTASQYFNSSTSAPISEVVTAPALAVSANPTSLTVKSGASTTSIITLNAVGGLTGLPSLTCGSLPAHISCSFSTVTNLTLPNPTVSSTLTLSTNASAHLLTPRRPGDRFSPLVEIAVCGLIPLFGIATAKRRRSLRPLSRLLGLALFLALTSMVLGLGGCSGNNDAVSGTYSVPVNVVVGSTTATLTLSLTVTP
jgi:phospholipase/lecithinase/hemolysin